MDSEDVHALKKEKEKHLVKGNSSGKTYVVFFKHDILDIQSFDFVDFIFDHMVSSHQSGKDVTSDVILLCRDGPLPGHKLVLAAVSEMFHAIFREDSWDEVITILMPDFTRAVLADYFEKIFKFRVLDQAHEFNACIGSNTFKKTVSKVEVDVKVKEEDPFLESEDLDLGNMFEQKLGYGWMDEGQGGDYEDTYDEDYNDEYEEKPKKGQRKSLYSKEVKKNFRGHRGATKDFIWEHFVKNSEEESTCKHCGTVVREIKRIGKKRRHVLENHREMISQDHRAHLQQMNNIDVNNFDPKDLSKMENKKRADKRKELLPDEPVIDPETGAMLSKDALKKKLGKEKRLEKRRDLLPDEPVVDPESGNMLSKDALVKDIKSRETKDGKIIFKKGTKYSPVWEYFSTDPDNPAKCVCKLCQTSIVYVFNSSLSTSMLKYHLQAHHNLMQEDVKIHICSHCGKSFKKNSLRLLCEDKHNNIFKHICSLCGKGFNHKHQINSHMRSHTGETPHQCTDCGKSFREKTHLNKHMKIHTGTGRYHL